MKQGNIRNILAGFLIGIGCVLPGVSGGVMAVSFGLYRPMLDAALDFFRDTRKKLRFLLPVGIGGTAGILVGAKGLSAVMAQHEALMLLLFTGFILGGIPGLWKEAVSHENPRPGWVLALAAGAALALPLMVLTQPDAAAIERLSPMQALAAGAVEGIGTVVPGVSGSFVLIRLGWYQAYLNAVSSLAFPNLLWLGAGFAASAFLCMKGVQRLFDRAPGYAYSAVFGFLLVSIALVFPGFHAGRLFWADAGMLVIGVICARWLGQIESPRGE